MKKIIYDCYKKSFSIKGRATRKEYWTFILFQIAVNLIVVSLVLLSNLMFILWLCLIFMFVSVPASLTLIVRRLHDIGLSGWYFWILILIWFVCNFMSRVNNALSIIFSLISFLVWLYVGLKPGMTNHNKYGAPAIVDNVKYKG